MRTHDSAGASRLPIAGFRRVVTRGAFVLAVCLPLLLAASPMGYAVSGVAQASDVGPGETGQRVDVVPGEALGALGLLAGPANGSFEGGVLTGWTTTGRVESVEADDFDLSPVAAPAIAPTDGFYAALLCNGPGNINGAEQGNLDNDPNSNNDNDRSTMKQSFALSAGELPATLSFDWNFLSSETNNNQNTDDFFLVTLNGVPILTGSVPSGGVSPFPDVPLNGFGYEVASGGSTDGCDFEQGQTFVGNQSGFVEFTKILDTPGPYELEFLVSDQGSFDHDIDSGLLIDDVQVTPEIDLVIDKTANPNPAIAGETLYYDVGVVNDGTGGAFDVVVVDVLPTEVVYISDTNDPPCVQAPVGTLTCDLGSIDGGGSKSFQIKTVVAGNAAAGGALTLTNRATVTASNPDRDPSNNEIVQITNLGDSADLKITKVSVPGNSTPANQPFVYKIYVDNFGPSYARNVTVVDDILASGTFTLNSVDGDRPNDLCTPTATGFECDMVDPLEPQGFAPGNGRWTITVNATPNDAVDVQNLARVFSKDTDGPAGPLTATSDPNEANNMAMDFIAVTSTTDLRITKIGEDFNNQGVADREVIAGQTVLYRIVVQNIGLSDAENVTVTDQLPTGLVEGSLEGNITVRDAANNVVGGGLCTLGTSGDPLDPMVCQIGDLEVGGRARILITADVDPSYVANQPPSPLADYLSNDAFVTSDTFDENTLNNRAADAFVHVIAQADLRLAKSAAPDPAVLAGQLLSYLVTVTNGGPSTAEGVVIDDDLPPGTAFVSAEVLGGVGSCAYAVGTHRLRCNLDNMLPTTVVQILLLVRVDSDVPDGTTLTNTVRRNPRLTVTDDPVARNDSATADTDVIAEADLAIEKSVEPVIVSGGEKIKYTVSVKNYGPADALDVVVYDVLPDEVDLLIDTAGPMCTQPTNLLGFRAELDGANEVPPATTDAMGLATFVLDTASNVLTYSVQVNDISGITGAHIHFAPAGSNGGVVQSLYGGAPPAFDPPNPIVGHIQLTPAESAALAADHNPGVAGGYYVNVHTPTFPGGEIRAQLVGTLNRPMRCEIGTLPSSADPRLPDDGFATRVFEIYAKVKPDAPTGEPFTNVAIVTSPTEPTIDLPAPNGDGVVLRDGANNVAAAKNLVEGKADVRILKFGKPDSEVRAGEILTYTLVIDNLGPGSAGDVAVKDILQSSGIFDLVDIASDRDARCVGLPGPAAVAVPRSPWPPSVPPPPGIDPATGHADINQRLELDCILTEGDDPLTLDENESTLEVLKADGPPNSGRWILTVRVRADERQDINNIADVVSKTEDPNLDNNHAEVEHTITEVADLVIRKTAEGQNQVKGQPGGVANGVANSVTAGLELVYTLRVSNNGPSTAENVVVFDRLPPGIVVTGVRTTRGACTTGAPGAPLDRFSCGLGDLLPVSEGGPTVVIAIRATVNANVPDGTILENDAFVTSDVFDDDNRSNFAHNLTRVNAWADMSATKAGVGEVVTECDLLSRQPIVREVADQVTAGRVLRYEIAVTNQGPSDAQMVTLQDVLQPGAAGAADPLTFIRADGADCRPDAVNQGVLYCTLGTMPAGARHTFDIYVRVAPTVGQDGLLQLLNQLLVLAGPDSDPLPQLTAPTTVPLGPLTNDPFATGNLALHVTDVGAAADLEIQKMSTPEKVFAGEQKKYTIWVTNHGPSVAKDVVVTDYLPPEVTYEIDTLGPPCALTGQAPDVLTCKLGTLEPGESVHFDVFVLVDPATVIDPTTPGTTIVNRATVASPTPDVCLDNNEAISENLVQQKADLKIVKFGKMDGQVRAGEILTYTVMIDNLGPSYANRVAVKDLLQSSGKFDLIDIQSDRDALCQGLPGPAPATPVGRTAWPVIDLPPPAFEVLPPTGVDNIDQRLEVDCTLVEGDDSATPQNEGRLAVLQADGPQNSGRWILTMRVRAPQTQDINNIADVLSDAFEPNFDNNHAEVEHEITDVADLAVEKLATGEIQATPWPGLIFDINQPGTPFPEGLNYGTSATQVTAGRRISYTLTVTNLGPSDAENTVLSDRLPPGVTIVPGTLVTSQGACETGTPGDPLDRLTCGLGTILALERGQPGTATVSFDVLVDPSVGAGAVLENDAFVTSDIFDDVNANNYGHTQTVVNTWADMSITKNSVGHNKVRWDATLRRFEYQDLEGQVTAGHELRYEITVQNNGPSDALNVTVRDYLPDESLVTYLRADGASCRPDDENQNILFCSLGTVPAGARRTFDIYVHVDPAVTGQLRNYAEVLYGPTSPPMQPDPLPPGYQGLSAFPPELPLTDDPYTSNNYAYEYTTVNAVADVYITKKDVPAEPRLDFAYEPDQAIAGSEHRYLITFGNEGWSTARGVGIQDFLDFKQAGILGETLQRCEPVDPDDAVVCTSAGGVVTVESFRDHNDVVIPSAGNGTLHPHEEFSFWLITKVDAGYVLDGDGTGTAPDLIAADTAVITTSTTDFHTANNQDTEITEIIAEADLTLVKVDDAAGFLQCDPVAPGGMITYDLEITNHGPSDAADVYLVDWLPDEGIVLDPAQVLVTIEDDRGDVAGIDVRDDGRIEVRLGFDPNNRGGLEYGRINADTDPVKVQIQVMVALTAECGSELENLAWVETRRNDDDWPPAPEPFGIPSGGRASGPRTPTFDPDTDNNVDLEATTIECPSIEINKTVSFDGTCPGIDVPRVWNQVAQPVTFCFEITNTGTTWLDDIVITDTLTTRMAGAQVIFTDVITHGVDPKLPVAPGETVLRQVTIPHLTKDCGIVTDTVEVTANPVNSGRTDLPCLPDVHAEDTARIDVPCAGVDFRLQLPALDVEECDTWITVQNVGSAEAKALLVVWGEPGACPPQAAGPLKVECSGLLRPGSSWRFAPESSQLPAGAKSGIVYSLNATDLVDNGRGRDVLFADFACFRLFDLIVGDAEEWYYFDVEYRRQGIYVSESNAGGERTELDFGAHPVEPLAVVVNRSCPDPVDPNVRVNAAYTGISSDMEGARDPRFGGYTSYAPLVIAEKGGLNSWIWIHNSGDECTSLEIWFKAQDNCLRPILGDILNLAPGESVHFDPNTVVGPDWIGSAWIRASQPLGIVVDTMGPNHFTSYNGIPGDVYDLDFSLGTQVNYAPLIYSEYQGWDTAIQVQNLSSTTAAKVKVYFLDRSGDVITTLVDWVCPRGSQSFFLPVVAGLPGNWVGSARVESQEWWSPGDPVVEPPRVMSVVLLEKWSDPARSERREAVAYNATTECWAYDWQVGKGNGGVASGAAVIAVPLIAKENRGVTTEVGITNLVPKPGFTDFAIFIYDQNGLIDFVCQKLNEKQVEYIDLSRWGWIAPRFLGSAVISAVFWEHDVFDNDGGFVRNVVGLGAVGVERVGGVLGEPDVPGDESKAFEGFPVFDFFLNEGYVSCPGVPR